MFYDTQVFIKFKTCFLLLIFNILYKKYNNLNAYLINNNNCL